MRITKGFPISPIRLYLTDGSLQPKIFDTRDLIEEAIGTPYDHKIKLKTIYDSLPKLAERLHAKNEKFLEMQKTGIFHLGDIFYCEEIS